MVTKDELLAALPIRGVRVDVGTKSSKKGGALGIVDLEPAAEFESVNAVTETFDGEFWLNKDLVPLCFENIVRGVQEELREHFGPELPAMRVIVHNVLPDVVETNELNNGYVGKKIIRDVLRRLEPETAAEQG